MSETLQRRGQVSIDESSRLTWNAASTGAALRRVIAALIHRVLSRPNVDSDILQINNMSPNGDEASEGIRTYEDRSCS